MRVFQWLKNLWGRFCDRSAGRAFAPPPVSRSREEPTATRARRLSPAAQARYSHNLMSVELKEALAALESENAQEVRSVVRRLVHPPEHLETAWNEEGTAILVGTVIRALLREYASLQKSAVQGWRKNDSGDTLSGSELIDQAFATFLDFRRNFSAPVPEAMPLIVELARRGRADMDAVRAYLEYLAFHEFPGVSDWETADIETRIVHDALQAACNPARAGNDVNAVQEWAQRNRLVGATFDFQWPSLNLLEIHFSRHDFAAAREALLEARERGPLPDDPQWLSKAGVACRRLKEWKDASTCFSHAAQQTTQPQRHQLYAIDANLRDFERGLESGCQPSGHSPEDAWGGWRHEMDRLLSSANGTITQQDRDIFAADIQRLRSRLSFATFDDGDLDVELHGQSLLCEELLWDFATTGSPALEDLMPGEATRLPVRWALPFGRWLLDCGRLSSFDRFFGNKATRVLPADREALTIDRENRISPLTARPRFRKNRACSRPGYLLQLQIENALELDDAPTAARLLQEPQSQLMPRLSRNICQARLLVVERRWPEAHRQFLSLLQEIPHSPRLIHVFGWCALQMGQDELFEACAERVMQLAPQNVAAALELSLVRGDDEFRRIQATDAPLLIEQTRSRLLRAGRFDLIDRLAEW